MKKILLFLTISFIYLISSTTIVNASTDSFYEGEYIDNIYMARYDKNTKTNEKLDDLIDDQRIEDKIVFFPLQLPNYSPKFVSSK